MVFLWLSAASALRQEELLEAEAEASTRATEESPGRGEARGEARRNGREACASIYV